jgi:Domain of unknown function (DUF5658)
MEEKRTLRDRRQKPTSPISRHTFLGKRETIRRKTDQEQGGYVDRYSSALLILLVLVVGLNILDSLFTMMILDSRGYEVNPVVGAVIELHGEKFWIWKFGIVSFCLVLLCLHSKFKWTRGVIILLSSVYLAVVIYQLFLLLHP